MHQKENDLVHAKRKKERKRLWSYLARAHAQARHVQVGNYQQLKNTMTTIMIKCKTVF